MAVKGCFAGSLPALEVGAIIAICVNGLAVYCFLTLPCHLACCVADEVERPPVGDCPNSGTILNGYIAISAIHLLLSLCCHCCQSPGGKSTGICVKQVEGFPDQFM
jgi:hypothetical protein